MKIGYLLLAIIVALPAAFAQWRNDTPPQGINGRTMEYCKADISKYCERANLMQECLVAHWNKISSDCQDALATPMRGGGD